MRRYLPLIPLLGFSFLLVAFRYQATHVPIFRFLWWNLFLALLPWWFSLQAEQQAARRNFWGALALGAVAVVFLPNAPYIVTDLFHLRTRAEFPLWYDTLLIFWFALTGIWLFYQSLFALARAGRHFLENWWVEAGVAVLCVLSGFGIYLGRYLRFNSWDVLSNPDDLAEQLADRLINPSTHTRTVGVTLLYGAFLLVGYWIVRLTDWANERVEGSR